MNCFFSLDKSILFWINLKLANPILDVFFLYISQLGQLWVLGILTAIGLFSYSQKVFKQHWFWMMFAAIFSLILVLFIKDWTMRPRPPVVFPDIRLLGTLPKTYAFPSAHTQSAFCIATYLSLIFKKKVLSIFFLVMALLVGVSRIYIGVHYPSDVIIGAIIGSGFGFIVWKWRRLK